MESRKEKQNYLVEEIMNKGYNTEEFVNYLSIHKGAIKYYNRKWRRYRGMDT